MTNAQLPEMLADKKAAKRVSAAKAIGKTASAQYGPCLLAALQKEVGDVRTWQAQCAMIKALADIGFRDAIKFLWQLSERDFENTMIYDELGFSIGRLVPMSDGDIGAVHQMVRTGLIELVRGGFRAVYFLRIVPERSEDAAFLISEARGDFENEGREITKRCYLAAAAAGWNGDEVKRFLEECKSTEWKLLREIVDLSLAGTYSKWTPW